MEWLIYLGIGAFAGLLAGLFGVGGGAVIVPILIFLFASLGFATDLLVHLAVGTSFATIVITSLSSIAAHHKRGNVNWQVFRNMAPGLVLGVLLGSVAAASLKGEALKFLIGVFLLLVSLQMMLAFQPKAIFGMPRRMVQFGVGGFIGWMSAFFGIGGGSLTVPFLSVCKQSIHHAVGTSAACGLPIALFGAIAYGYSGQALEGLPAMATGFIYWPAFVGIAIASTPFAKLGALLAMRLPEVILKRSFSVLLAGIGLQMLLS